MTTEMNDNLHRVTNEGGEVREIPPVDISADPVEQGADALLLMRFVVHLRNRGIKFVDRGGNVLARRQVSDPDPLVDIVKEFTAE